MLLGWFWAAVGGAVGVVCGRLGFFWLVGELGGCGELGRCGELGKCGEGGGQDSALQGGAGPGIPSVFPPNLPSSPFRVGGLGKGFA